MIASYQGFRSVRIVLLFAVVSWSMANAAAQERQVVADSTLSGWLRLIPSQEPGEIWVDSVRYEPASELVLELSPGPHVIRIIPKRAENWMVRSFEKTVVVNAGDTLEVEVSFPQYTMINTRPYGADVFLSDRILGKTPALISRQRVGNNPVKLHKQGYQDTLIKINDYTGSSIWVDLIQDQEEQRTREILIKTVQDKNRNDRKLAAVTLGLSVASGVAALLLKDEANRTFDRYLRSGSTNEMNRLFDRTKKYDRLAATAFIVFEANLIASSYLFIRSILRKE